MPLIVKRLFKTYTRLLLATAFFGGSLRTFADPISSASCEEALAMAERIASKNTSWTIYRTVGSSMGDFFGSNSFILVKKVSMREVKGGMLILYRSSKGMPTAHRVIENRGPWLKTAGMDNTKMDPIYVKADAVEGIVFGVLHAAEIPNGPVYTSDGREVAVAYCKSY
jgi:hypothetical protein